MSRSFYLAPHGIRSDSAAESASQSALCSRYDVCWTSTGSSLRRAALSAAFPRYTSDVQQSRWSNSYPALTNLTCQQTDVCYAKACHTCRLFSTNLPGVNSWLKARWPLSRPIANSRNGLRLSVRSACGCAVVACVMTLPIPSVRFASCGLRYRKQELPPPVDAPVLSGSACSKPRSLSISRSRASESGTSMENLSSSK
jgi:hypothetical protein